MGGLWLALGFLTRLPVPTVQPFDPAQLARSVVWFPVVGLLIGALVMGAAWLGSQRDPLLGALAGLLVWVAVTGALHLDGLADSCDALGAAHRDRERFLAVLADPHLGAFGVVALLLQLLAKFVLLLLLARDGHYAVLLLIPAWARWGVLWWSRLPSLKPGLGEQFAWHGGESAWVIWAILLCLLSGVFAPVLCLLPLLVWGWRQFLWHRLGGMTGDLLGAGIEGVESASMLLAVVALA